MKLKFNTRCVDKNTNDVYEVGSVVEFDDERGTDILSSSFASVVEEEPVSEPKKKTTKKKE